MYMNRISGIMVSMLASSAIDRGFEPRSVRFVLAQHAELDFYSASSLKQQAAGRHVVSLGHIILIPSQTILAEKQQIPIL
jgi:hypothetical protein